MNKIVQLIAAFAFAGFLISCNSEEIKTWDSYEDMLEAKKSSVQMMSAEDLKAAIDAETEYYLIDCRENTEYDSASIKTAIHIPRGLMEFQISSKAHNHRADVIVFCDNTERSTLVAADLPKLKYSSVYVLEGGFDAWKETYPDLVELEPVGDEGSAPSPAPSSGGCGG